MVTKEEARYYSDEATLEGGGAKYINSFKTADGWYPDEMQNNNSLVIINVLPENYEKWAKKKNEEIKRVGKVEMIKTNIIHWASIWGEKQTEALTEMKDFSKVSDFSLSDLKELVKKELKKRKERIKKQKEFDKQLRVEDRAREFKESNFLFSNFGSFTDYLDIARNFHKQQPFYYDKHRIWWLWNYVEKKWERVDEVDLMNAIDDNTQNPSTNSTIKYEILESLKRIGRRKKPKEAKKTWIQFKDLIYDLKTEETFAASPEFFITNPIPYSLGNSEDTPIMDKILKEWVYKKGFQDESYVKTLKEIMAYTMLTYMPLHRIFCLIGEGLNGKGTFLRLIETLVGEDNCCATEIEILCSNRFESNKLHKKLVCFIGEVDRGIFKKTKTIKSLTGEDTVRIEFKGKDGFDGKNYANPIIATNHLPETSDKTKGFYRRWSIVDFPNEFTEKKNILDDIPKEEYNNFCRQALTILKELLERGEFKNDGSIAEREDKYEKHSNHINEFVKMYCEDNEESYIEFNDFYEKYNEYLLSDGLGRKSKVEIGRALVLKGFTKKVKKISSGLYPTTKMCIYGIKWRHEIEELM